MGKISIAVRRVAATVLFVGIGAIAGLAAPVASASPALVPTWGPMDGPYGPYGGGYGGVIDRGFDRGIGGGFGYGPDRVWHAGPTFDAPPVLVESWKIDWCWNWRYGEQGLNWYLDPPF